jgi:hypothetical protein
MKLILVTILGFLLCGCATDNRERIAMETLYTKEANVSLGAGRWEFPSLTGALNGKFPRGSDFENIKKYVGNLGGSCFPRRSNNEILSCSIVESVGFCVGNVIEILIETDNQNRIENITATHRWHGC